MENTQGVHQCHVCNKSFKRKDRLRRHLESHQNRRSFKCFDCGKAYNRRDSLIRHYATHERSDNRDSDEASPRRSSRAHQACQLCAASKLKCDNETPCRRCRQGNHVCTRRGYGPQPCIDVDSAASLQGIEKTQDLLSNLPKSKVFDVTDNRASTDASIARRSSPPILTEELLSQALPGMPDSRVGTEAQFEGDWTYPMYFEQIMIPQDFDMPKQTIPDVTGYMNDGDSWSNGFDLFDFDINMASFPGDALMNPTTPQQAPGSPTSVFSQDSVRLRFEAFRRSPWLWTPSLRQHAFSEQSNIAIHERDIDMATPTSLPAEAELVFHEEMSQATRDQILKLVIEASQSKVSIPAFPTHGTLDTLMKTGISKRARTDSWLHLATFRCGQCRPELLTALVSAGCVCIGITKISRMGLVLQEIVRMSLERLVEADNSVVRDLQYLQASMLWIDIGITCGYTRKMEIAESHFQPLCTALRRAGAFDRAMYHDIMPEPGDDSATLDEKWHRWAKQESFKRLAYHVFEHDMRIATMFQRNPLTSFAEFTAEIPCSSELWLASSGESWRDVLSTMGNNENDTFQVSLQDLISRPGLLETSLTRSDIKMARSLLLNGLAGQVFEFRKSSKIADAARDLCSTNLKLGLRLRQEDLYHELIKLCSMNECDPAIMLFREFLLMSLYVDLDNVQRFAGKHGEREARRAHGSCETWFIDKDARKAAWHAGQVLRSGRCVLKYQLRGFEAIALYQATLVLWVYGVLKCALVSTKSPSRWNKIILPQPMPNPRALASPTENDNKVFLDGPATGDVKRFLELGQGAPGLQHPKSISQMSHAVKEQFCDLRTPHLVMSVGVSVLESNYPASHKTETALPPLPHRLRELMQALGALPDT